MKTLIILSVVIIIIISIIVLYRKIGRRRLLKILSDYEYSMAYDPCHPLSNKPHDFFILKKRDLNKNRFFALINKRGIFIIPFDKEYTYIRVFFNDVQGKWLIKYSKGEKIGLMNLNGKIIIPCNYFSIEPLVANRYFVKESKESAGKLVNEYDIEISSLRFDRAEYKSNYGFYELRIEEDVYILTHNGQLLTDPCYKYYSTKPKSPLISLVNKGNNIISLFDKNQGEILHKNIEKIDFDISKNKEEYIILFENGECALMRNSKTIRIAPSKIKYCPVMRKYYYMENERRIFF